MHNDSRTKFNEGINCLISNTACVRQSAVKSEATERSVTNGEAMHINIFSQDSSCSG